MKINRVDKSQAGFGLIELMVAMSLGLVLLGGVIQVFVGNIQIFKTNNGIGRVQENARFAISEISRSLRSVGYAGCMSKDLTVTNQAASIYGLDTSTLDMYTYQVPSDGTIAVGSETITGATPNTDAITVKTLAKSVKLTADTTVTTLTVNDASAYAAGDVLFIGDCEKIDIADISSVSGNVITLADSLATPYSADAAVHKVEVITYYIALSGRLNVTSGSLYKKVNNDAGQELAVGVDNMKYLVGVDSDTDNIPNQFFAAGSAGIDVKKVMVVRMLLNTTSINPVGNQGVLDRNFTVSISLRNRLAVGAG